MFINLNKSTLPFVVFITGACVLIIEIVATRILSPYFGNTIFTISSVIGIVLAALSIGYYYGGKLADKSASAQVFYTIILASGVSVVVLHILSIILLPVLGYKLSLTSGPIVTAIVLFFAPAALLGMLSPFAIKLQVMRFPKMGIGEVTGGIFFWSTVGSIFGSLFAGFVLIPRFGIDAIVLGVALTLGLLGLFPLLRYRAPKKTLYSFVLLLVGGVVIVASLLADTDENIVYRQDGVYEKITIYDGELKGRATRFFQQDRSKSGAMYLDSDELVLGYTKYYALYKLFTPDPEQVLVIGGGAYSIPKALLNDLPQVKVDVSEIEPSLHDLAIKYFNVPETDRLNSYVEDGRRFLFDSDKSYDYIFSDVYYSLYSIPAHFTTVEFFEIAKEKLNKDGIFIASLIGDLSRKEPSFIMSEIKTFQSVFPNSYFFAVDSPAKIGPQLFIFLGYKSDTVLDFSDESERGHEDEIIRSLADHLIDMNRFELSVYTALSDNYAPVEYFTARMIERNFNKPKLLDGEEMMALIAQQLRYGPRHLSAEGHAKVIDFIQAEMDALVDEVVEQSWQHTSPDGVAYELTNIIGRLNPALKQRIILATHFDSKKFADRDSSNPAGPVPGANDSASGVAALIEMARVIANMPQKPSIGIDFVFFDGEEGEETQGSDYTHWIPLGSTHFANTIDEIYPVNKPLLAVVLDMVCDKELRIYKETSSLKNAPKVVADIWKIGQSVDASVFSNEAGPYINDDHTSLSNAGIPGVLIMDPVYPAFHTTRDTLDKCSPQSLETVVKTVLGYVYNI